MLKNRLARERRRRKVNRMVDDADKKRKMDAFMKIFGALKDLTPEQKEIFDAAVEGRPIKLPKGIHKKKGEEARLPHETAVCICEIDNADSLEKVGSNSSISPLSKSVKLLSLATSRIEGVVWALKYDMKHKPDFQSKDYLKTLGRALVELKEINEG